MHAIQMELACRGYMDEPAGALTPGTWPTPFDPARARSMHQHTDDYPPGVPDVRPRAIKQGHPVTRLDNSRLIRSPRGSTLSARSWLTEAPLRMLMNNLDPDVAERPEELVVYGGIGRAARDWESFDEIVATLRRLGEDQTLLVQSGKPVGVFQTHADAPARADRQLQPGAALGDLGPLQRTRSQGPGHVRPDDRRLVDLHRRPGHRAGHLSRPSPNSAASTTAATSAAAGS